MKSIETYDSWTRRKQKIINLELDPENVRLEINELSQDAIIKDLYKNEQAFNILRSIIDYGWLPDEIPVVIDEDGKTLVIEGNRRLASLKGILNPKILPTEFQGKVSKLTKDLSPLTEIEVLVAPDRASTDRYLASKHTVNTKRPWTTLRRASFYYAQKEKGETVEQLMQKYPNTDIPKYIKMYEMHKVALSLEGLSPETLKKVENKRDFDITNLERLYSYKSAQEKLGIAFNPVTGEVKVPKNDNFKNTYARIIEDVVSGHISSRKHLDTEENAKTYLKEIIDGTPKIGEKVEASKLKSRSSKTIKKSRLFPSTLVCTIENSPGIERRLEELQKIPFTTFKYASIDSLRSFLEITLKQYLRKIGEAPSTNGNFTFLESALKKLKEIEERNGGSKEIAQDVGFLLTDKVLMDAANHNPGYIAVEQEIKDVADKAIRVLEYIFEKYQNDKNKNSAQIPTNAA
ncbi:MAG: hypothetical protein ABIR91_00125 [Candidatus Saccharimonadales bacterium]